MILIQYVFLVCLLIIPCFSRNITNCKSGRIDVTENNKKRWLQGYINAELRPSSVKNVFDVHDLKFDGNLEGEQNSVKLYVSIGTIERVRVQYLSEYRYGERDGKEIRHCNIEFIENDGSFLREGIKDENLRYFVEHSILETAEICIENEICNFQNIDNTLSQDVKTQLRTNNTSITSQATLNALFDQVIDKVRQGLIDTNGTELMFPGFNMHLEYYGVSVNLELSPGTTDVLKYIRRIDDVSLALDDYRFTFGTTFALAGGNVVLNAEEFSVSWSFLGSSSKGPIRVSIEEATLRLKVILDYSESPCKIHVEEVKLQGIDNISLSSLGTSFLKLLPDSFVSYFAGKVDEAATESLTNEINKMECENYRSLILLENFSNKTNGQNADYTSSSIGKDIMHQYRGVVIDFLKCVFSSITDYILD